MKNKFLETIKIFNGEIYNIHYHQQRYENTLRYLGYDNFQDLSSLISPPSQGLLRCRMNYTPDNVFEIEYLPYKKKNIQTFKIVYDDSIEYPFKYEDRSHLNRLLKQRDDCDEILIIKDGYVTDTSIANIAFYDGKSWVTPKTPLLHGTTRQRYLENAKILESNIRVKDLNKFNKVALLNAMVDFDIITNISYMEG